VKVLRFSLYGLLALILVLAVVIAWGSRDADSYDDRGLEALARPPIPAQDNGYRHIAYLLEEDFELSLSETASCALQNRKTYAQWDPKELSATLAANAAHFEALRSAAAAPHLQIPLPEDLWEFSSYQVLFDLYRLLILSSQHAIATGETGTGIATLQDAVLFAEAMKSHTGGVMIDYMIALALQELVLEEMRRLAVAADLGISELRAMRSVFEEVPPYPEDAFDVVLANEFLYSKRFSEDVFGGSLRHRLAGVWDRFEERRELFESYDPQEPLPNLLLDEVLSALFAGYLWHHNANMQLIADDFAHQVAQTSRYCADLDFQGPGSGHEEGSAWGAYMPNGFFQEWGMAGLSMETFFKRRCANNLHIEATRATLALQEYARREGDFPDTLKALVPDYLVDLPLDSFDGQPLRYDASLAYLYSVGENYVDDGGAGTAIFVTSRDCFFEETCLSNPTFLIDRLPPESVDE